MKKSSISWVVVIICLMIFWPVGLFLLLKKLADDKTAAMGKVTGLILKVFGWFLIGTGALGIIGCIGDPTVDAGTVIVLLFFIGGGVMLLRSANKTRKTADAYRQYINVVVNNGERSIDNIAAALGKSIDQVKKDLQTMIDKGYFPTAYIDQAQNQIMLPEKSQTMAQTQNLKQKNVACPNCGANNVITEGSVGECEYCGSPLS